MPLDEHKPVRRARNDLITPPAELEAFNPGMLGAIRGSRLRQYARRSSFLLAIPLAYVSETVLTDGEPPR